MYSVILATMMSVQLAPAPSWGCHGCHGCYGSCHGCCGGCYGCCGGGYGCCGGSYGCCGGGYGCCGGWSAGCYGGYGCYGAYSWYGCSGAYSVFGCGGGYGGSVAPAVGGFGAARSPRDYFMMSGAPMVAPAAPAAPPAAVAEIEMPAAPAVAFRPAAAPVAATVAKPVASQVTVRLPANAKLYVNDDLCPLTSDTRSFQTPQLKGDKEYSYTLRAEVERNGQTFTESKKVVFTAGKPVSVEFKEVGTVRTVAR